MKRNRKSRKWSGIGRFLSVGLMILALLFLTTSNYFVSVVSENLEVSATTEKSADSSEDMAATPGSTEEKTSSGSLSVIEEYLHKNHFDFSLFNSIERFRHAIAVSQKIELVHFKLLSPPPEA